MNKDIVLEIIHDEELRNYNWFEDHSLNPNEVSINKTDNIWCVFTTDERCSKVSEKFFLNEHDALENFLKRVRADKRLSGRYR